MLITRANVGGTTRDRTGTVPAGRTHRRHLLAVLVSLSMLAAACGGSSEERFEDVGSELNSGGQSDAVDVRAPRYDPEVGQIDDQDTSDAGSTEEALLGAPDQAAPEPPATSIPPDTDPSANVFAPTTINPWVDTSVDPQSTFALDVDTGSYTLVRGYLDRGATPPAEAVRVEEIVNYLDYGYPDPEQGDFRIELAGSATPFTSEQDDVRVVRVGLQSRRIDDTQRPDAALTFVVDTSGSMDMENRLGLVRSSLRGLVERLRPTDTVALVDFGSQGRVVLEPTPVSERAQILDAIDDLVPGGSTNAEAGLQLGYEQARAGFVDGGINRVVFAGDGMANVGTSDPDGLSAQVRRDADDGIGLLTLGFGMGHYSDHLMEQLAREGDGFYAYIDDQREADRLFGEQLTSTLQTLALDAKVQVTFDPAQVSAFRLVGFENRSLTHEQFRDDTVDAGDIGAGHAVTAIYEVRLAPTAAADATSASVDLRWADPDTAVVTEVNQELAVGEITGSFTDAPVSLQRATVAAYYAEVLRESPHVIDRGLTMAQVDQAAGSVLASGGPDGRFDELAALVTTAATLSGGG